MISKLRFDDLDIHKYQKCLADAKQNTSFAELDYLRAINGRDWDFLIYNDYEAVMPVHFRRKLGLKFVIPPPYINQQGVFSTYDKEEINQEFYEFLLKNYRVHFYPFNYQNSGLDLNFRINFRLENQDYNEIRKGYSVHRRRNVRLRDSSLSFQEVPDFTEVQDFYKKNIIGMKTVRMIRNYESAVHRLSKSGLLKIYVLTRNAKPVSVALIAVMQNEIALLGLINDKINITANDPSILVDQIIQKYCSARNINFFGSNIGAVAEFYRRFGAKEERYPYIFYPKKILFLKTIKDSIQALFST